MSEAETKSGLGGKSGCERADTLCVISSISLRLALRLATWPSGIKVGDLSWVGYDGVFSDDGCDPPLLALETRCMFNCVQEVFK